MELNWSTFLLEIINFLVLVWILKHFLYKPVLDVIARRRLGIEDQLGEARRLHEEAEAMKAEYENLLVERQRDRERAKQALAEEIEVQRTRRLSAVEKELAEARKKSEAAQARQREGAVRELQARALQLGAQFATRLLEQAVGPELEARLIDIAVDQLSDLSPDQLEALKNQWGVPLAEITVFTAFPVSGAQRSAIEGALKKISEHELPIAYVEKPELLAGLQVSMGAWELNTNLRDELKGFAEFEHTIH